jgi:hypothetical protein
MSDILPGKKRKKGEYFVDGTKFEVADIKTLKKTIPNNFIEDAYGVMEGKKERWSKVMSKILKEKK